MNARSALCGAFAALLVLAGPVAAQDAQPAARSADTVQAEFGTTLQVFLMTMGPGHSVYERFGHNAIWIHDRATGSDLVYNYGTFDFNAPNFVMNFVRGRPQYWLDVADLEQTMRQYAHARRNVDVQELNLRPSQRAELAAFLANNLLPENRSYRYDYFLDNCSTRVRDALDRVLGGALARATRDKPAEGNFRFHTQRSIANDPLMYTGIMLGQGPRTDRPIDQWAEMFLPAKLSERVREITVYDSAGQQAPLVVAEGSMITVNTFSVESAPPAWGLRYLLVGATVALLAALALVRGPVALVGRITASIWLLVAGCGGVVLLMLWLATDHVFSAQNRNILLMSPLALAVIPSFWVRRPNGPRRMASWAAGLMILSLTAGAALALDPSLGGQWNLQVMQLAVLPGIVCCLCAVALNRRPVEAPPLPH